MSLVVGVLFAVGFLLVWRLFRNYIFKVFEEAFVVYHVMGGGEGHYHQTEVSNLRIYPFVLKTEFIDEALLNDICQQAHSYVAELSVAYAQIAVRKHSHIVILRDRMSGVMRGMLLFTFKKEKDYTLFVLGGMYMEKMYRGEMYMYLAPAYYVLRELIWHPFTPIYLTGKGLSYKSYLLGLKTFRHFYPRYDKKTPEHLQKILINYGDSIAGFNEVFNHETGVIERNYVAFKEHVAPITDKDRKNPHIKFFEEKNPGWIKGNCLVGITQIGWRNLFRTIMRGISKGNKELTTTIPGSTDTNATDKRIYTARKSILFKESKSDLFASVDLQDIET